MPKRLLNIPDGCTMGKPIPHSKVGAHLPKDDAPPEAPRQIRAPKGKYGPRCTMQVPVDLFRLVKDRALAQGISAFEFTATALEVALGRLPVKAPAGSRGAR